MTMQNVSIDTDGEARSLPFIAVLCVILVACILLTISGNILVILIIVKTSTLREDKSNLLILNLAVIDMLRGCIAMPTTLIAIASDVHSIPTMACNLMSFAHVQLLVATMLTLCFISIDRFYAVTCPFKYTQNINSMVLRLAIPWTWIQGMLCGLVPWVKNWVRYDYWQMLCLVKFYVNDTQSEIYVIVGFTICFMIPSLILGINYIIILFVAQKKFAQVSIATVQNKISRKKQTIQKARAKSAISFIAMWCVFILSMTPFCVLNLIRKNTNTAIPGPVITIATLLTFISSVLNPLIYGLLRTDFRNAQRHIFGKRGTFERNNRVSVITSSLKLTYSTTGREVKDVT